MPRNDGTGPKGKGPRSGRGLGNCKKDMTVEHRVSLAKDLVKLAQELTKDQKKYREFFENKMSEWGIEDPSDLNEEQRKKFFNEIEVEWDEDDDEPAEAEVVRPEDEENKRLAKELLAGDKLADLLIECGKKLKKNGRNQHQRKCIFETLTNNGVKPLNMVSELRTFDKIVSDNQQCEQV